MSGVREAFDQCGKAEVLRHIAPKSTKPFPVHEKLRLALPRDADVSIARFSGSDVGADMDRFAYFALSMVWRGAVQQWVFPDGNIVPEILLGDFEEGMRSYLLAKTPLPLNTAVIVIVCSDKESRKVWVTPSTHVEAMCLNFRFLARGVFFRVLSRR